MKEIINTEYAPKPVGPYSQAIKVGNLLFISGQIAIDPKQGNLLTSDIRNQTERVMQNVKAILEAANYSLADIVQTSVYLSSLILFRDFNVIYSKYFEGNFPARTTIEATLLPGALVEISAIAYKDHANSGNKL